MSQTVRAQQQDLTTLANAKAWLSQLSGTSTAADAVVQMAITRLSAQIINYLQRDSFISQTYTEFYDGTGGPRQFLEHWPVSAILSLKIDNQDIPAAAIVNSNGSPIRGYRFEDWDGQPPGSPQQLELIGYTFCRGMQNVAVTYVAGYITENEQQTITEDDVAPVKGHQGVIQAQEPFGIWRADSGVSLLDGTPMVRVTGTPAAGQYSIDLTTNGRYLFNPADIGTSVKLNYSFCPYTVEQVCMDWLNEVMSRRNRPGMTSRSLSGQEHAAFDTKAGLPLWAAEALQAYMSVIPL